MIAGVVMVPALYAVATAATDGGHGSSATVPAASSRSAEHQGAEQETEHGVVVQKPHGRAATPSLPEATAPTTPTAATSARPEPEIEHPVPEPEIEHPVPEPGDDHGRDLPGTPAAGPVEDQTFSSIGGSITVTTSGSSITLSSTSAAPGFTAEVHDNGPTRVEVRFSGGGTEWRIRVDVASGGLASEVTQHG